MESPPKLVKSIKILVICVGSTDPYIRHGGLMRRITTRDECALYLTDHVSGAMSALQSVALHAVILADNALPSRWLETLEFRALHYKLIEYTDSGGLIIFGMDFGLHASADTLEHYFAAGWGLPWRLASYSTARLYMNADPCYWWNTKIGPVSYLSTALLLTTVEPSWRVYTVTAESWNETEARTVPRELLDIKAAAVVFQPYGGGRLGFIGDFCPSLPVEDIHLCMMNLTFLEPYS